MSEISYNPKVSLNPKVKYTTQSAKYDRLIVGKPLTDKRIEHYERLRKGLGPINNANSNSSTNQKRKSTTSSGTRKTSTELVSDLKKAFGL